MKDSRGLQLVYEALQRQIIRHAMAKNVTLPKDLKLQLDTLKNENGDLSKSDLKDILRKIKENSSFNEFICKSYDIIAKTPMAEYWLSFMEMVEILVMNIHSLNTKNWIQFNQSIRLMIPWLQIYDKLHYGKWLPEVWSEMINCLTKLMFIWHLFFLAPLQENYILQFQLIFRS